MTNYTHESKFVTDTIGLVLRIERRKMGPSGKEIFDSVESNRTIVYIPAMVFAEILYLSEKRRIGISLARSRRISKTTSKLQGIPYELKCYQIGS